MLKSLAFISFYYTCILKLGACIKKKLKGAVYKISERHDSSRLTEESGHHEDYQEVDDSLFGQELCLLEDWLSQCIPHGCGSIVATSTMTCSENNATMKSVKVAGVNWLLAGFDTNGAGLL